MNSKRRGKKGQQRRKCENEISCRRVRTDGIDAEGKKIPLYIIRLFIKAPHIYIGPQL